MAEGQDTKLEEAKTSGLDVKVSECIASSDYSSIIRSLELALKQKREAFMTRQRLRRQNRSRQDCVQSPLGATSTESDEASARQEPFHGAKQSSHLTQPYEDSRISHQQEQSKPPWCQLSMTQEQLLETQHEDGLHLESSEGKSQDLDSEVQQQHKLGLLQLGQDEYIDKVAHEQQQEQVRQPDQHQQPWQQQVLKDECSVQRETEHEQPETQHIFEHVPESSEDTINDQENELIQQQDLQIQQLDNDEDLDKAEQEHQTEQRQLFDPHGQYLQQSPQKEKPTIKDQCDVQPKEVEPLERPETCHGVPKIVGRSHDLPDEEQRQQEHEMQQLERDEDIDEAAQKLLQEQGEHLDLHHRFQQQLQQQEREKGQQEELQSEMTHRGSAGCESSSTDEHHPRPSYLEILASCSPSPPSVQSDLGPSLNKDGSSVNLEADCEGCVPFMRCHSDTETDTTTTNLDMEFFRNRFQRSWPGSATPNSMNNSSRWRSPLASQDALASSAQVHNYQFRSKLNRSSRTHRSQFTEGQDQVFKPKFRNLRSSVTQALPSNEKAKELDIENGDRRGQGAECGSPRRRRWPQQSSNVSQSHQDEETPLSKRNNLNTERKACECEKGPEGPHDTKSDLNGDLAQQVVSERVANLSETVSEESVEPVLISSGSLGIQATSRLDDDPLSFIEIKSAAQWRVMSQRISWNFEDQIQDCNLSEKDQQAEENCTRSDTSGHLPQMLKEPAGCASSSTKDPEGFKAIQSKELRLICWRIKPGKESRPRGNGGSGQRRLFCSLFGEQWGVDCDEVTEGLFIGDKASASNIRFLKKYGITHVLNTAEGKEEGLVDLSNEYFSGSGITYMGFPLWDTPSCNILPYLGCASEFIDSAISSGGKCLVNCQMGVSRSSSCAMSYLMIKQSMDVASVLTLIRRSRDCRPNDGFLDQLISLDSDLRKNRDYGVAMTIRLSKLGDLPHLPKPWHHEFWVHPMTEEQVGMPLVPLGQPCPLSEVATPPLQLPPEEEPNCVKALLLPSCQVSAPTSRRISREASLRSSCSSGSRRTRRGKNLSRRESVSSAFGAKEDAGDSVVVQGDETPSEGWGDDDWEWVYEDVDDHDAGKDDVSSKSTTKKLEEVKEIIEKPEERWRTGLWDKPRSAGTGSSLGSTPSKVSSRLSLSSVSSLAIPKPGSCGKNSLIQAGVDQDDPLSILKVGSAKQWKAISRTLTINMGDIDIGEAEDTSAPSPSIDFPGLGRDSEDPQDAEEEQPDLDLVPIPPEFMATQERELRLICWRIKPWDHPKERHLFTAVLGSGWGVDCDEVHQGIFVGDEASARNIKFLQKMGITHVLNTAEGVWTDCSFVDLTESYFAGSGIKYLGLPVWDSTHVHILPYLGCANEFIASALQSGGKVMVNCQMGVSRSATCAMSYMMITEGWTAPSVLRLFRKRRDVRPNDFYLTQLIQLDNDLRLHREHGLPRRIRLVGLEKLDTLPKPWHYEYWESIPTDEVLPFSLSHQGEPRPDMERPNIKSTEE